MRRFILVVITRESFSMSEVPRTCYIFAGQVRRGLVSTSNLVIGFGTY